SRAIDNQIKREGKVNRNTNILVVGTSGAGKSTLIKQMKLHNGSYTKTEREAFKPIIISTSVHAMTDIISIVRGRGLQLSLDNKSYAETILNFRQTGSLDCVDVPEDLSAALLSLYEDVAVRQVLARPPKLDLECSTLYFVQGILRITAAGYVPTDQDILYCHKKTNGTRSTVNTCTPSNSVIRYEGNISLIGQFHPKFLRTPPCMEEALTLFESICSSRSIPKTCGIILILNKLDCFREKLARLPLQSYCPNYTGGNNVGKACDYFLQGFRAMNGQSRRLYPSVIALREGIVNVQGVIQDSVMRRSLQETNVL
ncbi:G-protein alpha subunit-domain-containing protein, partial [Flagelloscypha sp. PMI_526]